MFNFLLKPIVAIGSTISSFVLGNYVYRLLKSLFSKLIEKLVGQLKEKIKDNIKNESLQKAVKYFIQYLIEEGGTLTGEEKFEIVKKFILGAMPDFVMSDSQLTDLIETTYLDLKNQIKNI